MSTPKKKTIKLFTPYDKQREIIDALDDHKFVLVNCGRQIGKTTVAWNWLLRQTLTNNDTVGLWVSKWHDQATKVMNTILKHIEEIPVVKSINKKNREIVFVNGSIIKFYSATNAENIRGESVDWLVADEFALYKEEAWTECISPTMAARPNARALFLSTPRGQNWWYRMCMRAKVDKDGYHKLITAPSTVSPFIDKQFLDNAKKTLPDKVYRSEILGEFVADTGAFFENVGELCSLDYNDAPRTKKLYAGVDCGFKNDYTVCTVFNEDKEMIDMIRFRDESLNYRAAAQRIHDFLKKYNFPKTRVEINQYDSVYSYLNDMGTKRIESFNTTTKSKNDIINYLASTFSDKSITLINDSQITEEFYAFEYQFTNAGNIVFGAPNGYHDDIVMSSAIALSQIKEKKKGGNLKISFV